MPEVIAKVLEFVARAFSASGSSSDRLQVIAAALGTLAALFEAIHVTRKLVGRQSQRAADGKRVRTAAQSGSLLDTCERLYAAVAERIEILPVLLPYRSQIGELVEDAKRQVVRIYVVGPQNAGKSTLINALLGGEFSPSSSAKLTACPVRIRQGPKLIATAHWLNGEVQRFRVSELRRRMAKWSGGSERPYEVVVETPDAVLDTSGVEIVDTPGTGSAEHEVARRNFEEEIVDSALRGAAIALIVCRFDQGDTAAQLTVLERIRQNRVLAFAVCNLDSNWKTKVQTSYKDAIGTIRRTEERITALTGARVFRFAADDQAASIGSTFKAPRADTLDELRTALREALQHRTKLVKSQAAKRALLVVEHLRSITATQITRDEPRCIELRREERLLATAIAAVRELLKPPPKPPVISSTDIGLLTGLVVGWALVFVTLPVVPLIGLPALTALSGAAAGYAADNRKRVVRQKDLAVAWQAVQRATAASTLISGALTKRVAELSPTASEQQYSELLDDLDSYVKSATAEVPEYRRYAAAKSLRGLLERLAGAFRQHLESVSASGEKESSF